MKDKKLIFFFIFCSLIFPSISKALNLRISLYRKRHRLPQSQQRRNSFCSGGERPYVQSATRTAKPISQAAENITVITAEDIEE